MANSLTARQARVAERQTLGAKRTALSGFGGLIGSLLRQRQMLASQQPIAPLALQRMLLARGATPAAMTPIKGRI